MIQFMIKSIDLEGIFSIESEDSKIIACSVLNQNFPELEDILISQYPLCP